MPILLHYLNRFCNCPIDWRVSKVVISLGRILSIYDPEELTNWFPDQAILEPRTGGKMKFSFYKKNSEKCDMDSLPEGTILEFTPNKKISYTWEHPSIADFPRTVVTWELEKIDNNKTRL